MWKPNWIENNHPYEMIYKKREILEKNKNMRKVIYISYLVVKGKAEFFKKL
jgi:hypothetical protein